MLAMLSFSTALRIRKTKRVVEATRQTAWVESVTEKEAEKYAKNRIGFAIACLLIGLFVFGFFIVLIMKLA